MLTITKQQAANYLIAHNKLNSDRDFLQIINDLSCLQVDPINVVSRSHELQLYNRNKDFKKVDLYSAIYGGQNLFEYWMQLYSIIPIEAFPYLQAIRKVGSHWVSTDWQVQYRKQHSKELQATLDFIAEHGPTTAKDISHLPKGSSVHSWKGESSHTALLEFLWNIGEVQICKRGNIAKYYDLTERVIPEEYLNQEIDPAESYKFLLNSYFKYLGLTRPFHFNRSGRDRAKGLREEFARQLKQEEIIPVQIKTTDGLSKTKYYIQAARVEDLLSAPEDAHQSLNILSPLDPLIHDRQLSVDAFDFFYRWEAYTPPAKRQFGFYNMPILYHGKIVGQIDMAKSEGKLKTKGLYLTDKSKEVKDALKLELKQLETFSLS